MSKIWPATWAADARVANDVAQDAGIFARGVEEGRRTAELEFAAERDALAQLAGSLETLEPPEPGRLAALIVEAVARLVRDIAGSAPVDAGLLNERAAAVADLLHVESAPVLCVHPDDLPLIDTPRLVVPVRADASVPRGTVRASLGEGLVEDGIDAALDRLRDGLAGMGVA